MRGRIKPLTLAGAFCAFLFLALSPGFASAAALPVSTLTVTGTGGRSTAFSVEVAASSKTRETGLMNRTSLPDGTGMIFIFPAVRPVMMWMKDTLLPLDMLFIDARGRIVNIAENTKPMDETIIGSGGHVAYVLEIAGGASKRLGIVTGDTVAGPALAFKARD
jgi:uncharacterized membrane protein (UPF0127 family)